jgi:hypothetical protein
MHEQMDALKNLLKNWLDEHEAEADCLLPQMWATMGQLADELEAKRPPLTKISAEEVKLLVTDDETGRTFLRKIPLDYLETSNGITLAGETYAAQPTQIVFLTEFALGKLMELQGEEGEEHDHDHHHDHDHPHYHD